MQSTEGQEGIRIIGVLSSAEQDILEEIVGKEIPTMSHREGLQLLGYVGDVVMADTGPRDIDRPETYKETCYNLETL